MTAFWWALLTAVIWGIVPVMEKVGLGQASPAVGVVVRSGGVMLGVLVFGWIWNPWPAMRMLSGSTIVLLMAGGFLASFVGQLVFYHALKIGAVSQIAPVAGIYPLIAACLGWICLREPFTLSRTLGVLCIVVGVILLRK